MFSHIFALVGTVIPLVACVAITDIQGSTFASPYTGKSVTDVTGIVTAKTSSGFYLLGNASSDAAASNGLVVYTTSATILASVKVGDSISLSGKISEYRSTSSPNDLSLTELGSPSAIKVVSSGNTPIPIVLGVDRSPPTQQMSALDVGTDGYLSVPGNASLQDASTATLQPTKYGLDFWESLEGQLVTIKKPTSISFGNSYNEFWVYGDWNTTGLNNRGGLSIIDGPDGTPDANPEAIIVGSPIDGTNNTASAVGVVYNDITGVITYQYGFFYLLPLTAPTVASSPDFTVPPTTLTAKDGTLTIGDYNVENMAPNDTAHIAAVADHIANYLKTPDLMFIQEIQDDSGPTSDGTVSANVTLQNLVTAISKASGGVTYDFVNIPPVDGEDGGEPGGNIRVAYLWQSSKLSLAPGTIGSATEATAATLDSDGKVSLTHNPGRIDPTNAAWKASRKPLVAAWDVASGGRLITINVQFTAKLDSSSTEGNARPPVNAGVAQRTSQANVTSSFIQSVLAKDTNANVILSGDFNEYSQTTTVFAAFTGVLTEIDESSNLAPVERYTYVYDQNCQQLDHMFLSANVVGKGMEVEHVHVNTWASEYSKQVSDHDPSVARVTIS